MTDSKIPAKSTIPTLKASKKAAPAAAAPTAKIVRPKGICLECQLPVKASWARRCVAHEAAYEARKRARYLIAHPTPSAAPKGVQRRSAAKPLPAAYAPRVLALEAEGMTTSDAQGVTDVEFGLVKPAAKPKRTSR